MTLPREVRQVEGILQRRAGMAVHSREDLVDDVDGAPLEVMRFHAQARIWQIGRAYEEILGAVIAGCR